MDDSTRSMRNTIVDRDIFPALTNRLLTGTGPGDIRQVRSQVKDRGAFICLNRRPISWCIPALRGGRGGKRPRFPFQA